MLGLIASQVLLAAVLVGLGAVLLSLARQIGVLHERTAPVGGLLQKVRQAERIDLDAVQVATAANADRSLRSIAAGRPLALLFVAERCPVCKSLLPTYQEALGKRGFSPFVVGDGASARALARLAEDHGVARDRILAAPQLAAALQVLQTPTLALLDRNGKVLQKTRLRGPSQMAGLASRLTAALPRSV